MSRFLPSAPALRNQKVGGKCCFLDAEFSFTPGFCCVALSDSSLAAGTLVWPAPEAAPGGVCSVWEPKLAGLGALPELLGGDCVAQHSGLACQGLGLASSSRKPQPQCWDEQQPCPCSRTGVPRPPGELAVPALLSCCLCSRLVSARVVVPFLFLFCFLPFLPLFWEFCGL